MVKQKTMSSPPVDRERRLPRVTYAVIQSNGLFNQQVLIAADEENLGEALAFEVISQTPPKRVGIQLAEIRDALSERRWADALVAWMEATGYSVDVFPDEPIRSSLLDEQTVELELKLTPIFADPVD